MEESSVSLVADESGRLNARAAYWDGRVVVGEAGERAGRHRLLMQQRGAALGLGLGAALGQALIVDLVLLIGNLLTEPGGTTEQKHYGSGHELNDFSIFC